MSAALLNPSSCTFSIRRKPRQIHSRVVVYTGRIVGRDCHYWHSGFPALAGNSSRSRSGTTEWLPEHMKQLALANHNYIDARKAFPAGARGWNGAWTNSGNDRAPFVRHILPYIEEKTRSDLFNDKLGWPSQGANQASIVAPIKLFQCPSEHETVIAPSVGDAKGNYGINWGARTYQPTDVVKGRGPFGWGTFVCKIRNVSDGMSKTMLMMEMLQAPDQADNRGRIWNDADCSSMVNALLTPNATANDQSSLSRNFADVRRPARFVFALHGHWRLACERADCLAQPSPQRGACRLMRRRGEVSLPTTSNWIPGKPPRRSLALKRRRCLKYEMLLNELPVQSASLNSCRR
jgi:hypothetical protein